MKIIRTEKFSDAVYDYEIFKMLEHCDIAPETNLPKEIRVIYPGDMTEEERAMVNTPLISECGYMFRKTLSGRYIALRMTMHPKTIANYKKGSRKYGSGSIMNEMDW